MWAGCMLPVVQLLFHLPPLLDMGMTDLTVIGACTMTNIVKHPTEITMTSLELVDYINSERDESERALRHDHFMVKVPKVLGENAAPNFRGSYLAKDGSTRPCYNLPKREACLMAMSYSYDLQAKVFDKMTELEQAAKEPALPAIKNPQTAALMYALAKQDELEQEQQRQSVEIETMKLAIAKVEATTQPENEYFTVAGFARLNGLSVDLNSASGLGKRCSTLSKREGKMVGKTNDPRWGFVNTYHVSVLQAILNH